MYLKSIEVQGFKSFANKIKFDFHNGITGIVGPNGSGKSNVADAVRWVLGEQSAKQLRGSKMEDVIFAGTQSRKPVGYAYVSITLDNSDHALLVDYDEVTVTRKVYRSGESEYQINGHSCRLKDISELFYDTGIGKEGYSIIGQGQIEKILSGKPEERRELFDEAAGIVKFKRRKAAAEKKLDNERNNLVRVNDILSELEKQVGPLEKQSTKAKQYIEYKNSLKIYDVNGFLIETDRLKKEIAEIQSKQSIASQDLDNAKAEYESTKAEYEAAEQELSNVAAEIDSTNQLLADTELDKQKLEGSINVCNEQIKTIEADGKHYSDRIHTVEKDISSKGKEIDKLLKEKASLNKQLEKIKKQEEEATKKHQNILNDIEQLSNEIESHQNSIYHYLNEKSKINADNQRYKTMLEQLGIKKSELQGNIIKGQSEENEQDSIIKEFQIKLEQNINLITDLNEKIKSFEERIAKLKQNIADLSQSIDKTQQQYHREKSRLESLINITERYDGYGNSIRKVMEQKSDNNGILGVIADLIKVEKKYETAIETALGGTIQNIVTDNEQTAKKLISFLKENKYGRATFLPLNAINVKNTLEHDEVLKEAGVLGVASSLVRVSFEYEKLSKYLLGRVLVVDNIDHALSIAKKYKYSLRIVTIEGEQLNPGGSMTGGAFKNSSNLLGRRREIEELKKSISEISSDISKDKDAIAIERKTLTETRELLDQSQKQLREALINKKTSELSLNQAENKKEEVRNSYRESRLLIVDIEKQISEITQNLHSVTGSLTEIDTKNQDFQKEIDDLNAFLEKKRSEEVSYTSETETIRINLSNIMQKESFTDENIQRIRSEIDILNNEILSIRVKINSTVEDINNKKLEIASITENIEEDARKISEYNLKTEELKKQRDDINNSHKVFFEKREKISTLISQLDKECYRLGSQHEKLQESNDTLADYMWNEYELTYSYAYELRNDELNNLSDIKKNIQELKLKIRGLGDVNVNAIEEYKEVNERFTFLKAQHDDLIEAEQSLVKIIDELDNGMRIQFEQKFKEIKEEFDKVFRELFGGGRGTIELVADEDILEAGIIIISQPPGKKLQNMMQLSGGEKTLTAICLLFAIQNLKPSPFCLLDEIEAALDDSNVGRFANYLHKLTKHTQFIVITHRRGTMAAADRLYGITMQEKGISTLVSVDLIANDLENTNKQK